MTIKEQILSVLEQNKGKSVSGEQLANMLFCSRNAVWKAVKVLQNEGYAIEAVTKKGYCLSKENTILSPQSVEPYLEFPLRILTVPEVDSTNNELKKMAEAGEPEGTVLVANRQTGGKGRMGRQFFSPGDSGLYMSVLLRPKLSAEDALLITTAAAVAVAKAIEALSGKKAGIKWVNDIFVDGKKVCGILTEAAVDFESGGLQYAVLGIGINVCPPTGGFPPAVRDVAGAVFKNQIGDIKSRLCAGVLNHFFEIYQMLAEKRFMQEYQASSIVIGKRVTVVKGESEAQALVKGIDDNANLIVQYDDGSVKTLSSGEIRIKM